MEDDKIISEKEQERISVLLLKLNQLYPNATTALNYKNPFQLLIATILSAQCTDKRVNKVTEVLFKKYEGPEDFAAADKLSWSKILKHAAYSEKSKNIIETSKLLLEKYDGQLLINS